MIPEAGMEHAHRLAIRGAEFLAAEALVVPDTLQEPFRGMRRAAFAQEGAGLLLRAPLQIRVRPENGHGPRFRPGGA